MANTQKPKTIRAKLQVALKDQAKPGDRIVMRKGKWKRIGPAWQPNIADLKDMSWGASSDAVVAEMVYSSVVAAALRWIGLDKVYVVSVSSWGWPPWGKDRKAHVDMKYFGDSFQFKITPIGSTMYLVSMTYKLHAERKVISLYLSRSKKGDEVTWQYVFRGY